jgi:hypothetical protein
MKILLLGEYSGYYANLSLGFKKLGHSVTFFNSGHALVKAEPGIPYPKHGRGIKGKLLSKILFRADQKKFSDYDLVFVANLEFVNNPWSSWHWDHIRSTNKKVIYTVCGQRDAQVLRSIPQMRKSMFKDLNGVISMENACVMSRGDFRFCDRMVSESDGLITISGGYDIPYRNIEKPRTCIPLPIDTNHVPFCGIPDGPLQFLHGRQRRPFQKGTAQILRAFDLITPKPILHHVGGLSLSAYLKLMKSIHVVVDSCRSYGCGMNALWALAMGKIVMGGNEPENYTALGLPPSPVINLPFDVELIKKAIVELTERSDHQQISEAGRQYVEDHHEARKVAQAYIEFASIL